jgi:hypothetical protein
MRLARLRREAPKVLWLRTLWLRAAERKSSGVAFYPAVIAGCVSIVLLVIFVLMSDWPALMRESRRLFW